MFNSVNGNPFSNRIESALSAGKDNQQNKNQNQNQEEKKYLENDDKDEIQITQLPELNEDQIIYLVNEYISRLKSENSDNLKAQEKLDKFLSKFDVKKFMKQNPHMTRSDFSMVMYNETSGLLN